MNTLFQKIELYILALGGKGSIWTTLLNASVVLLVAVVAWLLVKCILATLEKRAGVFRRMPVRGDLFATIRKISGLAIIWMTGVIWIRLFHISLIEKVFHALFIILVSSPIKTFLLIVLESLETNLAERTENNIDNIVIDLLNKFSGAIVYAIAVVIALDVVGVNVMPFIAGAGVLGVAVGFAAKDTLSNLIAGILLIIDRPFEIGDRIEVWSAPAGSSSWGDVIDIGLRATRIKTTDNIVIIIPNNEIMTRDIVNYTILSSAIRVRINIGIAYDADIAKAKSTIFEVAKDVEWILDEPAPKVVVRNFGESSVDLQLRVWIKNARKRMDTISVITDTVKSRFDEMGISIPFPRRDITIINPTALHQNDSQQKKTTALD